MQMTFSQFPVKVVAVVVENSPPGLLKKLTICLMAWLELLSLTQLPILDISRLKQRPCSMPDVQHVIEKLLKSQIVLIIYKDQG